MVTLGLKTSLLSCSLSLSSWDKGRRRGAKKLQTAAFDFRLSILIRVSCMRRQSNTVNSHLCYVCAVLHRQSCDFPEVHDGDPWANHTLSATLKGPPLQNAKKPLSAIGEKLRDGRSPLVNCSIWSLICFLSVSRLPCVPGNDVVWNGRSPTMVKRAGPGGGKLRKIPTCHY